MKVNEQREKEEEEEQEEEREDDDDEYDKGITFSPLCNNKIYVSKIHHQADVVIFTINILILTNSEEFSTQVLHSFIFSSLDFSLNEEDLAFD